jgi:hypothetical protein
MALAPPTVQNIPDLLRREAITVLHPASTTRAHKEVLATKLGISHALRTPLKVVRLGTDFLRHIGVDGCDEA